MKTIERKKHIINASGKIIGRIASEAANILRGKNKVGFQYYQDSGDFVSVINFDNIKVDNKKSENKLYYRHSGYHGGIKVETQKDLLKTNPQKVFQKAVYGMLPKNRLRPKMMKRLVVFKGGEK